MSKRKVQTASLYTALWENVAVCLRAQDKSRAPPPHSFIGLTCRRGSGTGSRRGSERLARFRQRSVQPRCYLTSVIAGKHRIGGGCVLLSFGYGVTPLVAGAGRLQRRQASGS